jgi:non-specific serine/threonine protein kinase
VLARPARQLQAPRTASSLAGGNQIVGALLVQELPPAALRARRQALGLTQDALAGALGVTANSVARWERGEQRIGHPERLSAALTRLEREARRRVTTRRRRVATPPRVAPRPSLERTRHNLPSQITSFVGREQELADVQRQLGGARLLTLVGPGGIGKTRLALEVAARLVADYSDGVWFVELGSIVDPALVAQAVATGMHVPDEVGQPLVETLKKVARVRRLLLVLDNCEHLLAACADLAETLLRDGPEMRIMATSREPLRTGAESVWRVGPLLLPESGRTAALKGREHCEAVSLFLQRARGPQPAFSVTDENALAVMEVCRRLDGIPLAIELAAACVGFLSPAQIVARLDDRFALLSNGSRTAPPRQQSLAAAIEWSCGLLTTAELSVFTRLSAFAGSLTLEAAEAVCAGDGVRSDEVLGLVGRLVSKSLVVAEPHLGGLMGYRLLGTLRAYGRQLLRANGEAETVQHLHAAFYVSLAARSLYEEAPASWAERLNRQHDDLDAALRWLVEHGDNGGAQLLGAALSNVWRQRGLVGQGRLTLAGLLELPAGPQPTHPRASLLLAAGLLAAYQGDLAVATHLLEECVIAFKRLGEARELPMALAYLADLEIARGDWVAARLHVEAGLATSQRLADSWAEATLLVRLAQVAEEEGDAEGARALIHQALPTLRAQGGKRMIAMGLQVLADGAVRRGEHAEARRLLEDSLAAWSAVRGWKGLAWTLLDLGRLAAKEGNNELAGTHFAESLATCRDIGDRWGLALGLEGFVTLAARAGHPEHAVRLAGAAAALREVADVARSPKQAAWFRSDLASARRALSSARYMAAWDAGRAMSCDEAIRIALGLRRSGTGGQLTRREREVATLIARGWTNRQIAEALVIDRRTAEGHVRAILGKLGRSTRAQVVVWAIENGLGVPEPGDRVTSAQRAFT